MSHGAHQQVVTTYVHEGVGVISINRPERLNALTREVFTGLEQAVRAFGDRDDVRAVVLRGEGRAFCAGLDLREGMAAGSGDEKLEDSYTLMRHGTGFISTLRSIAQPVIAVVQGHAVGAGFAFATAADVRIIGPEARFSAPFVEIGMTFGDLGLSWFLPRIVGHGRAAELLYSAGSLDAEEAVRWGLASKVSDDPLAEAMVFATHLAELPPYGVQASKGLLESGASTGLRDHLVTEGRAQVIGTMTRSANEAMDRVLASSGED
jgi:enoyl-CoA hydratase